MRYVVVGMVGYAVTNVPVQMQWISPSHSICFWMFQGIQCIVVWTAESTETYIQMNAKPNQANTCDPMQKQWATAKKRYHFCGGNGHRFFSGKPEFIVAPKQTAAHKRTPNATPRIYSFAVKMAHYSNDHCAWTQFNVCQYAFRIHNSHTHCRWL